MMFLRQNIFIGLAPDFAKSTKNNMCVSQPLVMPKVCFLARQVAVIHMHTGLSLLPLTQFNLCFCAAVFLLNNETSTKLAC